jgi:hypothetical protein
MGDRYRLLIPEFVRIEISPSPLIASTDRLLLCFGATLGGLGQGEIEIGRFSGNCMPVNQKPRSYSPVAECFRGQDSGATGM